MKIGKLPEPVLIRSVLKQVKHRREEILMGPSVGVDCAALEVGADEVLVMSSDPITGQDVIVTKWIGLEATTILAKERTEQLLRRFSPDFVRTAKEFDQYLSVVPDARAVREAGVTAMHDITEGGVFGALWEMAEAGGIGLEVDLKAIPIRQETVEICEYFGVNPYLIMSSGSMMIVADDGRYVVDCLEKAGIHGTVVGRTTGGNDRLLRNGQEVRYLDRPQADELYRALEV